MRRVDFDMVMRYSEAKKIVTEKGWDGFFKYVGSKYPDYELYKCSMDWFDDSRFICKFKGVMGDVIIGWIEHHL